MEWISVKAGLPEEGKRVLVCNATNYPEIWLDYLLRWESAENPNGFKWTRQIGNDTYKVTHWLPFPKPPELSVSEKITMDEDGKVTKWNG